jgi:hypothetical protein
MKSLQVALMALFTITSVIAGMHTQSWRRKHGLSITEELPLPTGKHKTQWQKRCLLFKSNIGGDEPQACSDSCYLAGKCVKDKGGSQCRYQQKSDGKFLEVLPTPECDGCECGFWVPPPEETVTGQGELEHHEQMMI